MKVGLVQWNFFCLTMKVAFTSNKVNFSKCDVPTQYFEIYVAVHPISDVPVNCVPTQYLAPRYGTEYIPKHFSCKKPQVLTYVYEQ